ncbi:hypothetical protein BAU15_08690 [Enterococcus sp. JM4C]|uniref:hypothetical protein n=1 Tax=Candidatus Enterococcus huntleyi TaxID=1857217 RepID=UPI00137AB9D6|nr:hypothetical protein [Enterococcus sp. JM4C]KAF1297972.1 hypothetical protein BAU15_08690 [Enterococcus sp. JM4C]
MRRAIIENGTFSFLTRTLADYLMRQFKLIGEAAGGAIATTLNLNRSQINLGQIEDEHRNLHSGNDLLEDYLLKGKIHKAYLLIQDQKYRLSYLDMTTLTTSFIQFLRDLSDEEKVALEIDQKRMDYYKMRLNEL